MAVVQINDSLLELAPLVLQLQGPIRVLVGLPGQLVVNLLQFAAALLDLLLDLVQSTGALLRLLAVLVELVLGLD